MAIDKAAQKAKDEKLDLAIKEIYKAHGKEAIIRLGDGKITPIDRIPTGSFRLDEAIGSGWPRGRVSEIFGPESSGKTTLTLHAIAEAQKMGERAAFIDAEHALDLGYAKALGVDVENLWLSQPSCGEQALEITDTLCSSGGVGIVVVDSVSSLVPQAELDGEMGDAQMGLQARLMSQAMRKLTGAVARNNVALIFVNQLRMKIGVMFGNPETTSGGNSLRFYASLRLDIRKTDSVKSGDEVHSNTVKVKSVKNKTYPPFRAATLNIRFGKGIDRIQEVLEVAVEKEVISKVGSWYSFKNERLDQGEEKVIALLTSKPDLLKEVMDELRKLGSISQEVAPEPGVDHEGTDPEAAPAPTKSRKVKTAPAPEVLDLDVKPTEEAPQ